MRGLACLAACAALLCAALPAFGGAGAPQGKTAEPYWKIRARVAHTRPVRREGPLRATNIADDEVREIQVAMKAIAADAVVNIGGVTVGCPCEDGPTCSDQVWVVAYRPELSRGYVLSRIHEKWTLGPLQTWWLRYEEFYGGRGASPGRLARLPVEQRAGALQDLFEAFPHCDAEELAGEAGG